METRGKDIGVGAAGGAAGDGGACADRNGQAKVALVGSRPAGTTAKYGRGNRSPAGGSDVAMRTPNGRNNAPPAGRLQIMDGVGDEPESPDEKGRRKKRGQPAGAKKRGKGLRHFSMKVCEKVESKGQTSYPEVADELVAEFSKPDSKLGAVNQQQHYEKNIRRRVYDALNVLLAVEIISKHRREIRWKGLPSSSVNDKEHLKPLQAERIRVRSRIEEKSAYVQELQEQIIKLQNLATRNERVCNGSGSLAAGGIALPFTLVQTRPQATVEVEMSDDMQLVHFDFHSTPFELHDGANVLKAMTLC